MLKHLPIAFRRSVAAYFFVPVLILHGLNVMEIGTDVFAEWRVAAASVSALTVITLPLSAAAGALDSLRYRRLGDAELIPRPALLRFTVLRALAVWGWFVLAHTLALCAHWVLAVKAHGYVGWFDPTVAYVSTSVTAAGAALGVALGWLLPRYVTPPLLAVGLYLMPVFSGIGTLRHYAIHTTHSEFPVQHVNPALYLWQLAWFWGVAVCVLLVVGQGWRTRTATALAAAVAVAGFVGVSDQARHPYYRNDASLPALTCTGKAPQMCSYAESRTMHAQVAPRIQAALRDAGRLGLPTSGIRRVVPAYAGDHQAEDAVVRLTVTPPHVLDEWLVATLLASLTPCRADDDAHYSASGEARITPTAELMVSRLDVTDPPAPTPQQQAQAQRDLTQIARTCAGSRS